MLSLPSFYNHGCAARTFSERKLRLLGGMLIALASVQAVQAQQADAGPGRSPFLPQGWEQRGAAATARPAAADATESGHVFNGMIQIGSRTLFSIGNTQTGHATLVEAGDTSGDIQIASYDPQRNVVSLRGAGRTEELTLRKSDGEPLVVAAAANPVQGGRVPGGMQGRSPHNAQGGAPNRSGPPVEWLEARRNRLNEQIEQRRAQQAAEGSGAVAVGVDSGAAANTGSGRQGGGNTQRSSQGGNMQRSTQGGESAQGGQNARPRRLRMEMNP